MSDLEVLISKLFAIDALSTCSIELSEVATLCHEVRDNTMKNTVLEVEHLS